MSRFCSSTVGWEMRAHFVATDRVKNFVIRERSFAFQGPTSHVVRSSSALKKAAQLLLLFRSFGRQRQYVLRGLRFGGAVPSFSQGEWATPCRLHVALPTGFRATWEDAALFCVAFWLCLLCPGLHMCLSAAGASFPNVCEGGTPFGGFLLSEREGGFSSRSVLIKRVRCEAAVTTAFRGYLTPNAFWPGGYSLCFAFFNER